MNYTIEGDQIFLNWTHNAACFNYTFNFSIEWDIVGDSGFHGNITSELQYIIPGIRTRTYNVCIQAVNNEYALNGSLSCHKIYLAGGTLVVLYHACKSQVRVLTVSSLINFDKVKDQIQGIQNYMHYLLYRC